MVPFATAFPELSFSVAVIAAELKPSAGMSSAGSALRVMKPTALPLSSPLYIELPPHETRKIKMKVTTKPS